MDRRLAAGEIRAGDPNTMMVTMRRRMVWSGVYYVNVEIVRDDEPRPWVRPGLRERLRHPVEPVLLALTPSDGQVTSEPPLGMVDTT